MAAEKTRARGQLEAEILRILWGAAEPLTALEIQARFTENVPAPTTILTALDRLHGKGDVLRTAQASRGLKFSAAHSESQYVGEAMLRALGASQDRAGTLLQFTGNLQESDLELLRRALDEQAEE